MASPGASPNLRVQTVLYDLGLGAAEQFVAGLAAAARQAKASGTVASVTLAIGDCSPAPSLSADQIDAIRAGAGAIDGIGYEFFDANLGSAGGHNRLFFETDDEFVLVLNPDTYCSPFLLDEMFALTGDVRVGIVEGRQVPVEHPKSYASDGQTSWASGCCALIRRGVLADTGGFDAESFFLYGDDVDLSWRARLAGWKVMFCRNAAVFHDKRLTTAGMVKVESPELRYSAEAALLLPWKYSRADLAEKYLGWFEDSAEPAYQAVAADFRRRRREGRLPTPLDADHLVAEFVGTNYGAQRFEYGD